VASVDCEHLDKTYAGGVHALRDCSLRIGDGELVVLVGPSGCGKSTLLRIVAGLETASSGVLRIDGKPANDLTPQQRNVAMVFQDYALYPHMTVRRNLEYPLRMRRMAAGDRDARVQWAAQLLDIAGVLERLPRELSGGQRQRVAMGRALVREPAVFLLDEPLSNLDAKLRSEVRAEIATLQQRTGTTMLYVTHDQTEAMTLGHRVAVLNAGVLEQVAPPRELYEHPATAFVAGFIGNPPMNVFRAAWAPASEDAGRATTIDLVIADQRARVCVNEDVLAALSRHGNGGIQVGIRPEDVYPVGGHGRGGSAAAESADLVLRVEVDHVEHLGHETLVHAHMGDVKIIARAAGMASLKPGEGVALGCDTARLRFFATDGRALGKGAPR
jgi:multiple sugar transport system ATP-binding protein